MKLERDHRIQMNVQRDPTAPNKDNARCHTTTETTLQHPLCKKSASCTYLSLLTDDGHMIVQLDIMEQTLQEDVGHSNQVVVLLGLVERVTYHWWA